MQQKLYQNRFQESKKNNKKFTQPPHRPPEIIPIWSGVRLKRKFLRRMKRVFFGIERMGHMEENSSSRIPVVGTTSITIETNLQTEKLVPPHCTTTVLDIGRLFAGTVGDITINKSTKENPKLSSKIVSKLGRVIEMLGPESTRKSSHVDFKSLKNVGTLN